MPKERITSKEKKKEAKPKTAVIVERLKAEAQEEVRQIAAANAAAAVKPPKVEVSEPTIDLSLGEATATPPAAEPLPQGVNWHDQQRNRIESAVKKNPKLKGTKDIIALRQQLAQSQTPAEQQEALKDIDAFLERQPAAVEPVHAEQEVQSAASAPEVAPSPHPISQEEQNTAAEPEVESAAQIEPRERINRINQIRAELAQGYDDRYSGIAQDANFAVLQAELDKLEREEKEDIDKAPEGAAAVFTNLRTGERVYPETREEKVSALKSVVGKFSQMVGSTKEKVKSYASSSEQLVRQRKDLDLKAENIGGIENAFRSWGEKYNKLGWKSKLGIGLALGIGAGVAAPVNMGVASVLLLGVASQRILALSTMYLKFEKSALDKGSSHAKEKAMLKAILYTTAMTAGAVVAIREISDTDIYHRTQEWLGSMLGHHSAPQSVQSTSEIHSPAGMPARPADQWPTTKEGLPLPKDIVESNDQAIWKGWNDLYPDKPFPGYGSASDEINKKLMELNGMPSAPGAVEAPAIATEHAVTSVITPDISVGASSHGYEGMLKDLIRQLPDKPPAGISPDSDLAKLLEAKANPYSINAVIHKLAQEHGFFGDKGSALIDQSARLSVVNGHLQFTDSLHPSGMENAAANMHVTPNAIPVPHEAQGIAPEAVPVPAELPRVDVISQPDIAAVATPDVQPTTQAEHPAVAFDPTVVRDGSGHPVLDGQGQPIHSRGFNVPSAIRSII